MQSLRLSLFILSGVFVALVVLYLTAFIERVDWLREISLNLATEVAGILVTVWLVDSVMRKRDENNRRRLCRAAFLQFRLPLARHLALMQAMFKAAIPNPPEHLPTTFDELFGPEYYVQLGFLDLAKPAPVASRIEWVDYLAQECLHFQKAAATTTDRYIAFLDPEVVEVFEQVLDSSFLSMTIQFPAVRNFDKVKNITNRQYNLWGSLGVQEPLRGHVSLLKKIVELSDAHLQDKKLQLDAQGWSNQIAPAFGSARI
jgi:hypothetical protein